MNARRRRPNLGPQLRGHQTSEHWRRSVGASWNNGELKCAQFSSQRSWLWASGWPAPPRPSPLPPTARPSGRLPTLTRRSIRCTGAGTTIGIGGVITIIVAGGSDEGRRAGRPEASGPFVSSDRQRRAPVTLERGNEIRAGGGEAEAARLQDVTQQEESGQCEAIGDVLQ